MRGHIGLDQGNTVVDFQMVCSRNYGSLLVTDYTAAPSMCGYQNGTLIVGTTQMRFLSDGSSCDSINPKP